ncbi:MAG: helicase-related protein [Myxococcota bacterium]
MAELPVDAHREELCAHLDAGPVVLTSPTGSGKSTRVPTWCPGRVLVVEPRRVACRSLASWVASSTGTPLGEVVGYHVRDERRAGAGTRILFATPGIVLRAFDALASELDTLVLDEFHERRLDVDLLLALAVARKPGRLVVMSATLDGDRVARHVGGRHLAIGGRAHPVEIRYRPDGVLLPTARDLERRVRGAVESLEDGEGDVLVFLPGKGEIARVAEALADRPEEVIPLHGDLTLAQQSRAFEPTGRRRIVLATNVAETSVTVPGVRVVIDAGLVRRTRYVRGRGFLTLAPVALDSADQRAGRAGRTAPGTCIRLWDPAAKLEASTPPEVFRESLAPLVLAAAALGDRAEDLPFLDPPKPHALDAATEELRALGALDDDGGLTETGRELFGLPLDAHLGRLLVEARRRGALQDTIDLVAALAVDRPLFVGRAASEDEDLREAGCDAVAAVRAVRVGDPRRHGLSRHALAEARAHARRLRHAFDLETPEADRPVDRDALLRTAVGADPRAVHVARERRGRVGFSNGGTEIDLARESAAWRREGGVPAIVVLGSRAVDGGRRGPVVVATCAMPVALGRLAELGIGRERVAGVRLEGGRAIARIERVHAKRVIAEREDEPVGALAREAVRDLFLRGALFPDALERTRERLEARALLSRLASSNLAAGVDLSPYAAPPPDLEAWVEGRIAELGVERGEDVALLSPGDLTAPDLPPEIRSVLDREFPRTLHAGDAVYRVDYDLGRRQVVLSMVQGKRDKPPPPSFLPPFRGFRVCVEAGGAMHVVRER